VKCMKYLENLYESFLNQMQFYQRNCLKSDFSK
jgi:hypothetical protein